MAAVALLLVGLSLAALLGFTAFNKNMMYFYTPTDIATGDVPKGSVARGEGLEVNFTLADCEHKLKVRYEGILPDLFREGQGIVATGALDGQGVFVADEVLAKHDETYMPPELAEKLVTPDGKHSCAPFKPVSNASWKPRPQAVAAVPRPAQRGEGRTIGSADGGVRGLHVSGGKSEPVTT